MFVSAGKCLLLLLPVLAGVATVEGAEYDYFKYHPMEEIRDWMAQIQKNHSDVVTIMDYGKTYEMKTISLLKIGVNTGAKKKAIWMDCGIHAREWIAPAFCQYFVKQILDAYKTEAKMKAMMVNVDFYVTPVLNVDGYMYTWENSMNDTYRLWRKSRSPGPTGCSCKGTDLNRNFDANWGTIGVSTDCCTEIYGGTQPTSESEAQAVTFFVGSRLEDFLCFLTIHSYGQLLLLPYGHPNFTAENYDELMDVGLGAADAIRKVHGMNYTVGTSPDVLYPNSGSSRDWARKSGIPYTFTFELRDKGTFGFKLPEDQIQPTCEEAYAGAQHIITYVHDKHFAVDTTTAMANTTVVATTDSAATAAAVRLWTLLLAAYVAGNALM